MGKQIWEITDWNYLRMDTPSETLQSMMISGLSPLKETAVVLEISRQVDFMPSLDIQDQDKGSSENICQSERY